MTKFGAIAVAATFAVACGDNSATPPDASHDASPDAWSAAPHAAQPQPQSLGGPVLAAPYVVPVFFTGDDSAQANIESFLTQLAASPYWAATTTEYGVGALTIGASVVSSDTPPTTDDALQTFIETNTDGTHGWPTPTANTIYTVFLPSGVTLTEGGDTSCVDFGGYHSEIAPMGSGSAVLDAGTGLNTVYALIPRCATSATNALDPVTAAASHEFVEASTDPHYYTNPAWIGIDNNDFVWGRTPGAELGDMCEYVDAAFQRLVGDFLVQRTWSNASALAGHDPCVPVLATPYTGAAPVLSNDIEVMQHGGTSFTTQGVTVNFGTPVTLEVDLFSDGPVADQFIVDAEDARTVTDNQAAQFEFQWDNQYGLNGNKRHVIITRKAASTTPTRGSEIAIFTSQNGTIVAEWWAYVAGQ